tara:strand:- start:395 stop:802 length:408 start_codon:yes stop_codon:yes gene_type:complete
MAAVNLNTIRKTIEQRLKTELDEAPIIPIIFNNMPFESISEDTFVQCLTTFGEGRYLAHGVNSVIGLLVLNIFTEEGKGSGANYTIGKRLRDLYNKKTVSNVIFESPSGPEVFQPSPEGKFQTQIRIPFEIYERL